ncbi:MAG TPA: hypothetical protein VJ850_01325, partial [Candidatus Limnocylindrales bacterium]|nr:hypothetical protein [Candidatus Limnocylindrales bacterium]
TDVARRVVRDGLRGRIPTLDPGHQPVGLRRAGHDAGDGSHPTTPPGDPGVARSGSNDPGHS